MAMKDAVQNVLAVVVSYNRRELLMQCIHSLLKQDNAACDVLVVDNASTDGTGEAVNSLQNKRVSYYNTGKILGVQAVSTSDFGWDLKRVIRTFGSWTTIRCPSPMRLLPF